MKASLPLLLVEVGDYSLKTKNGNKDFQQQNKSIFLGNLCSFFSLWCTFSQELTIHDHESLQLKFWKFLLQLLVSVEAFLYVKSLTCCFESLWARLTTAT